MKRTLLIIVLLPALLIAQTKPATQTKAPNPSKRAILTVPEDEYVDSDNTTIVPLATGADFIVVTYDDYQKYYKYTKTEKKVPFSYDIWEDEVIISGKENELKYFKDKATGKKYGPYKEIRAHYSIPKNMLFGYSYVDNDKAGFVDLIHDKSYGPFVGGGLWHMDDINLVYSYSETTPTGTQVYLMENSNKLGPYDQVTYRRSESGKASPVIVYKKGEKYYVNQDPWKKIPFASYPFSFTEMQKGWAIEGSEFPGYKDKWIYLPNGKKIEYFEKFKHAINSKGQILRCEHVGGGGDDAAFKLIFDGKEIGMFAIRKSVRSEFIVNDFFDHQLTKVELNKQSNWALAYRDVNYYYSPTLGLIGPFTATDLSKLYFIADGYAQVKMDSTLEINGKKVLDDVIAVDFTGYPETWFALQQRGDYAYPFKNGVEVAVTEVPQKLKHFHTNDKAIVKVTRPGNKYFLRITATGKLLGPVSQYNESLTSKDGKHYITVMDETENVIADGKVVGKAGFELTYNEKLHAFHWLTQTGQQLNLHTYKLAK